MLPNVYKILADTAGFFGADEAQEIANAGSAMDNKLQARARMAPRPLGQGVKNASGWVDSLPTGLPAVQLPQSLRDISTKNKNIGATQGAKPWRPAPPYLEVAGAPSMQVRRLPGGGVEVVLERKSPYVGQFTDADKRAIERFVDKWEKDAVALSKGRLSTKRQAQMNHPYGHGLYASPVLRVNKAGNPYWKKRKRRALPKNLAPKKYRELGVSNMAVVNRQSGTFASNWASRVEWRTGRALLVLSNPTPYAEWLAFGTKVMKAHGPFTTVPTLFLSQLNTEWRRRARRAYLRQNAQAGFRSTPSQRDWANNAN